MSMPKVDTSSVASVLENILGDDVAASARLTIEQVRAMVAAGDIDLDDYKGAYKDVYEADPTISDEALMLVIAEYDTDENDKSAVVEQMKAVEDEGEEAKGDEPLSSEVSAKVHGETHDIAAKLTRDAEFSDAVENILKAKEVTARGPVTVLLMLERIWDDGDWAKVPAPGSKEGDATLIVAGSNHPKPHDLTDSREGNRKIVISWFKELVRSVNPKLFDDYGDIKETFKPLAERLIDNPQRREWNKMPLLKRMSMERRLKARIDAYKQLLEKAVKVRMIFAKLAEIVRDDGHKMIGCGFDWADRKLKIMHDTISPIHLWDNTAEVLTERNAETMTVGTFLKLWEKIDGLLVKMTGGYIPKFEDVIGLLRRDKEGQAALKLAKKFKIENASEALTSFYMYASWIDNKDNKNAFFKLLGGMKRDSGNPKVMSEYEETCHAIYEAMLKGDALKAIVRPVWEAVEKEGKVNSVDAVEPEKKQAVA